MRILFIGDIVGSPGRDALEVMLPRLKQRHHPDFILVNGENAASGKGITGKMVKQFLDWGVDGITLGNHTWDNKDIFDVIDQEKRIVRPANFPPGTPGQGMMRLQKGEHQLVVINMQGQIFLPPLDNPFYKMDYLLQEVDAGEKHVFVDFHAEATSEKVAMGWYLDGRVSCMVGTHTHVQTNDARILPKGTAYQTDVGMTGPVDGVIGMDKDLVLKKMLTQLPVRFEVAKTPWLLHAVLIDVDSQTGQGKKIVPLRHAQEELWME